MSLEGTCPPQSQWHPSLPVCPSPGLETKRGTESRRPPAAACRTQPPRRAVSKVRIARTRCVTFCSFLRRQTWGSGRISTQHNINESNSSGSRVWPLLSEWKGKTNRHVEGGRVQTHTFINQLRKFAPMSRRFQQQNVFNVEGSVLFCDCDITRWNNWLSYHAGCGWACVPTMLFNDFKTRAEQRRHEYKEKGFCCCVRFGVYGQCVAARTFYLIAPCFL